MVATGLQELLVNFEQHHFKIVEHTRLCLPIVINDIDALTQFGIDGTWFLNSVSIRMLPKNFLMERLKRLFSKIFTFPYPLKTDYGHPQSSRGKHEQRAGSLL